MLEAADFRKKDLCQPAHSVGTYNVHFDRTYTSFRGIEVHGANLKILQAGWDFVRRGFILSLSGDVFSVPL